MQASKIRGRRILMTAVSICSVQLGVTGKMRASNIRITSAGGTA